MSRIFGEKRSKPQNFLANHRKSPYLALFCTLYSKQTFKVHLGVEKHIERLKSYKGNMLQKC